MLSKLRKSTWLLIPTTLSVLLLSSPAQSYELGAGSGSGGVVTSLGKGLKELGFESMYVLHYDKAGESDSFRGTFIGGGTFRYYMIRNLSLGINANFLYRKVSSGDNSAGDLGFLGTVNVAYNASLGGGLFIRPLLGVGGSFAKRTATVGTQDPARASVFGGAGRVGLGLAFYASRRFKLHAGPEALLHFGKSKPDTEGFDAESFFAIDGAFNVGLTYVF